MAGGNLMPQYVIHVGPSKTGSTYLQLAFHHIRDILTEHGILYPLRWYISPSSPNHLPLAARLQRGGDEGLRRDFADLNSSKYGQILISAEDLSNLSISALALLKDLISGSGVAIVFYCRRWSETLPSLWQEWIKQGQSFTYPEFILRETEFEEKSPELNFALRLENMAAVFGDAVINLVSYSNIKDAQGDILSHFLECFLSITPMPSVPNKAANPSLDLGDVEMIRVLNALEWHTHRSRSTLVRERYLKTKKDLSLPAFNAAIANHLSSLSIDDSAPRLAHLHNNIFQRFGKRLVNPLNEDRLFAPGMNSVSYVRPDYLLIDGVVDEVRTVHNGIMDSTDSLNA
jgi:hypothetical protein